VATHCRRTNTATGVHYLKSSNRVQLGLEVMTDVLLALRADRFLGNGMSNVSAMVAVMKDWSAGDCTLIGHSQLMKRNLFIHVKP
jgi:protein O-GlcNAc transferase